MADNKNGHWYTDENGNHYFVENGQSPKEGWESTHKRVLNGKHQIKVGDKDYEDIDFEEYNRYDADEDEFDENIDADFEAAVADEDFERSGNDGEREYSDDAIIDYLENYDYTGKETLEDVIALAREYDPNLTQRDAEIMAQQIWESGRVGNNDDEEDFDKERIAENEENDEAIKKEIKKIITEIDPEEDNVDGVMEDINGRFFGGNLKENDDIYLEIERDVSKAFNNQSQGNKVSINDLKAGDVFVDEDGHRYLIKETDALDKTREKGTNISVYAQDLDDDTKGTGLYSFKDSELVNKGNNLYQSPHKFEDFEDARYYPVSDAVWLSQR